MEHLLGVTAVWVITALAYFWVTGPQWFWYLASAVLGIGWELLVDPSTWWLGVGIGGAGAILTLVTNLITVLTDDVKLAVLRHSRGRP